MLGLRRGPTAPRDPTVPLREPPVEKKTSLPSMNTQEEDKVADLPGSFHHVADSNGGHMTQSLTINSPPASISNATINIKKRTSNIAAMSNRRIYSGMSSMVRSTYGQKPATLEYVRETYTTIRSRCHRELGTKIGSYAYDTSFNDLLEWIRNERLTRLPHKGGSWDRVLISAQYFAEQVYRLSQAIKSFTSESNAATNLVFGQCLLLLELGYENAFALETAFNLFYQFGLELGPLLRAEDILISSPVIMDNVARAFSELLGLVAGVAITFYSAVHNGRRSTKLDLFSTFGITIDNYRSQVSRTCREMWNFVLDSTGSKEDTTHVEILEEWLSPKDRTLSFLASNNINIASRPEEFTCTWLQSHLSTFFKHNDDVLIIEGAVGTGKTILANWIVDRLQRPIGRKMVTPLSFFFNSSTMAQATTVGMLKTLLCQLLEQRIGDYDLYDVVAKLYTDSATMLTAAKLEERMWQAVESALVAACDGYNEPIALIIDGLDEMDGQRTAAQKVAKKLQELAHSIRGLRLIQISQPLDISAGHATEKISMSTENTIDDIQTIIRQGLIRQENFRNRDMSDQEHIIDRLMISVGDSMLEAVLCVQYLKLQKSDSDFNQGLDRLIKSGKAVPDIVEHLLTSMNLQQDSKSVLSWLIAAERPLSLQEVSLLLQAQPEKSRLVDRTVDINAIVKSITPFVVTGEGLISLRHNAVKHALVSIPGSSPVSLHLKERHKDLLVRLMICSKKYLNDDQEPSLNFLDPAKVHTKLNARSLLDYTVRYWTTHFKKAPSLYKKQGDLHIPDELRAVFPGSVSFVLLEAGCWKEQCFPHEAMDLFATGFRVRKALYGMEHTAVLQSAIVCALFCETVLVQYKEAIDWYAQVVQIGKAALGVQTEIVVSCCTTLLRISESLVSKSRTDIMSYREEVMIILVSSYKYRYGEMSKEVVEIYQKLYQLYIFISEEEKANEITIKIREIVSGTGSSSDKDGAARNLGGVELYGKHTKKDIDLYDELLGGYQEDAKEGMTIIRVNEFLERAWKLVESREYRRAEEIYIDMWLKLTEHCRNVLACEWHEKKIEIMLRYASFLKKQSRKEESSAVLMCLWSEYSTHQVSMVESIIILLKEVAICMKEIGMISVSLTVFQKCWSWYKSSHMEETSVFKEIEEQITRTSQEIVTTSSKTTVATSSETVIREVFESSFSETTEITTTTIQLCESLTSIYMEQQRWHEAISVIKSTLRKSWSSFFSESVESITSASFFSTESTELVFKLAQCYINQRRFEKAENLYLRLYRVHRKLHSVDHELVLKYSNVYLTFLEKHKMFNQVISFYQELLVEYRTFYGPAHAMTIRVLYSLGDMCHRHHLTHGYWIEYYLEIVTNLNKGAVICHEDAFRALIIVAEHYYETVRYSESIVYFKSIIATFCKFGTQFKYFEDMAVVEQILEKYYRAIDETKVDIHTHIQILREIREACFRYFGETSSISINVTVVLAEVYTKSEQYEFEAVSLYEHVLKHSQTVSSTVTQRTATTLRKLYVKQVTSSNTTNTVSKEVVDRATIMTYNRYIEIRKSHSITSETTLSHLKELVVLYHKQEKMDIAITEIKNYLLECIQKVHESKELMETARFVSSIYMACGYQSQALDIIKELKMQIIYKEASPACGFSVVQLGQTSFAFVAALEYWIRADFTQTISSYMAIIMAEFLFYERFTTSITQKSQIQDVVYHASHLRQILAHSKRLEHFDIVERQTRDYFTSIETAVVKASTKSAINTFVSVLLVYFSKRGKAKNFVGAAGHAAIKKLNSLLGHHKQKDALELATCTYSYLMAHEGLDDPTEITLGFKLCTMLAGHGEHKQKPSDGMIELSRKILGEVFDICKNNKIDLARCPLDELVPLMTVIGDQRDYGRLQWLLSKLWATREGQSTWSQDVMLAMGKRLVQAQFAAGNRQAAIRLAEDLVYNVRRVHGARHEQTLSICALLASLYTSMAQQYQASPGEDKKRSEDMAKLYYKKAIQVHEDVLKLLVDVDSEGSEDDEDVDSDVGSARGGAGFIRSPKSPGFVYLPSRQEEIDAVRKHLRLLKLAVQRYGGWSNKSSKQYDGLTAKIMSAYGDDLKMGQDQVLSREWNLEGYGNGRAEAGFEEDGFSIPTSWTIMQDS